MQFFYKPCIQQCGRYRARYRFRFAFGLAFLRPVLNNDLPPTLETQEIIYCCCTIKAVVHPTSSSAVLPPRILRTKIPFLNSGATSKCYRDYGAIFHQRQTRRCFRASCVGSGWKERSGKDAVRALFVGKRGCQQGRPLHGVKPFVAALPVNQRLPAVISATWRNLLHQAFQPLQSALARPPSMFPLSRSLVSSPCPHRPWFQETTSFCFFISFGNSSSA